MNRIARESLPGIIAALVAASIIAALPGARTWLWHMLIAKSALPNWLLLLLTGVFVMFGASIAYALLKGSLETGKQDLMTKSMRADQINPFLERRVSEAQSRDSSFAVLLVDIDNFKRINDEYNHEIGNYTLAELVQVIRPRSKGEEIFRYGGDEFLIVTNLGIDERDCWGYANRIVREVSEYNFLGEVNSPNRVKLTVSCGCLVARGDQEVNHIREHLVAALKKAKKPNGYSPHGKNSAYLYNEQREQVSVGNAARHRVSQHG